jgi:hypothetical protein
VGDDRENSFWSLGFSRLGMGRAEVRKGGQTKMVVTARLQVPVTKVAGYQMTTLTPLQERKGAALIWPLTSFVTGTCSPAKLALAPKLGKPNIGFNIPITFESRKPEIIE